ncbi:hypothetical protein B5X24_HaOG203727 [Helicoverpa armigera]|uniref:Uncharacterized protein n=1 Tax=Helicoverpa armigera TaxID=29058 RepID=A0A2W1BWC9_HELAM|nr:hypothetical protein B5X24_HaOG203727 [Helicoverpa armigera]
MLIMINDENTFQENYDAIISHSIGVLIWLTKVASVELGLCLACEAFYKELKKARSNVVIKLSHELPSKKVWKNIFRVLHSDFDKMSACGLFSVDAATLLNFCNLVATYTIVMLQFAFL